MVIRRRKQKRGLTPSMLDKIAELGSSTARTLSNIFDVHEKAPYQCLRQGIKVGLVRVDKSSRPYVYSLTEQGKRYRKKYGSFLKAKLAKYKKNVEELQKIIDEGGL